jgi:two-component system, OmpR family, KDP operon response regulator KdpE
MKTCRRDGFRFGAPPERIYRAIRMSAGTILVVDDDSQIRRALRIMLTGQGYEIDDAACGEGALEKLRQHRFDLVLLDVGMPGMDGLETCRAIREQSEIAIIMLTVRDREVDKIEALDAGADDYVTKPFKSAELSARIRAALRRTPWMRKPAGPLKLGSAAIDFDTRQVVLRGRHTRLTPKEFELLRYLVAHANRVLTHREILQAVWGPDRGEHVDSLRVVINQLRNKIEAKPATPQWLLTEPWVGYRLFLPSPDQAAVTPSQRE